MELRGEGPLGSQRVLITRAWETRFIDVNESGSYSSEVRSGEVWTVSFVDTEIHVGVDPVHILVEEGETAQVPPIVVDRKVYERKFPEQVTAEPVIALPVGAVVRWVNLDATPHDLQLSEMVPGTTGVEWAVTGEFGPGEHADVVLTRTGTFTLRCTLHPEVAGEKGFVIVG